MEETTNIAEPDRVFVLRFWQDAGMEPTSWHGEVKELGETRQSDKRFLVAGLSAACEVIAEQLQKSIMRE